MRVLALSAFALAVNVDQVDNTMVEMDFEPTVHEDIMIEEINDEEPNEEEEAQLDFFRGETEAVDDQELAQLEEDVPNVEKELVQMEDELDQLADEIEDELPEICAQLGIENRWGSWFRRATRSVSSWAKRKAAAARRAAQAAARRAAAIARAAAAKARAALNWAKNKASALANQFRNYMRKVNVMKKVKYVVDKFFQVTESRPFKLFFFKW